MFSVDEDCDRIDANWQKLKTDCSKLKSFAIGSAESPRSIRLDAPWAAAKCRKIKCIEWDDRDRIAFATVDRSAWFYWGESYEGRSIISKFPVGIWSDRIFGE